MTPNLPLQTIATPRDERRPTVFISYCREDKEHVDRLIAGFAAAGHFCWIDTSSIKGGEEWVMAIADGILNSYALVAVVTMESLRHKWVRREILFAQDKQKPVIPWVLEDVAGEREAILLTDCQWVTGDYTDALPKLLAALPSPQPRIGETPSPGTQRELELAYLERLSLEELINIEKHYTPMSGGSRQRVQRAEMPQVCTLRTLGKDGQLRQEKQSFPDAVKEIRRLRRAALLGEPGGGKTTTLWKLAAELAAEARQDQAAPIPLLVRLGLWTDGDQPLPDFIAAQLGDLGGCLDALLREGRAALLLDGLNELPTAQRDAKYPQVQKLIKDQVRQHPKLLAKLLAVVSCREQDYTVDLGFNLITITPLDPLRIRQFVGRYLGEESGEALFWRLAGGAEVQPVWEAWQKAGADFELFWTAEDIPHENPDVYNKTTGEHDRIWQEKVRGKHSLMELARNPYMLWMLTCVYHERGELPDNRGELFRLFVEELLERERIPEDEQTPLSGGLAQVAFEMQMRRAPGNENETGDAQTVLSREEVRAILDPRQLYLAASASILSTGELVRFTHQLLQEYFAAKFMDGEIRAGRLNASGIWKPGNWWQRANWEEAAILLAGLYSDDCSPVVEWLAEANPEVAAQCAIRSGADPLPTATLDRLRRQWIPRLTDLTRDPQPQARAAVGRALGLMKLDNRKGVGVIDGLPDIDWVEIPGGEFQYGHQDESEYVSKPQKLTLPTFHISRYPVTYAQFQTFLDDAEGYAKPQWFDGLAASEDQRRMYEQSFKFANHPRESVNWYQAMAFCRWLSWRWGGGYDLKKIEDWAVRLPTEFEWEKAARGPSELGDGRIYPYGNDYDAGKGNTERNIGQTNAVGIFPNGASPYGVEEMSGNVWEWCLSNRDKPALDVRKEKLSTNANRVLRGGSWANVRMFARAVVRYYLLAALRNDFSGFRVVLCRPPSS